MTHNKNVDVIIIGGSYAGLSAAMALGRSRRNVLIIDSGLPCNRQTPHSHNFLTQDGEMPSGIAEKAKMQVLNYSTVEFLSDRAVSGQKTENGFAITTPDSGEFHANKLIFATGVKDIIPNTKGFSACWGVSVIHCPYCHGYEFRNQKTGIVANGEKAFHLASLVNNLTDDITMLTSGKAELSAEQIAKLNKHNIKIIEKEIAEIVHDHGQVKYVALNDGSKINFNVIYAPIPFLQHSDIPVTLGCEMTEEGYVKVDSFQKTSVYGVFACGDNASMMRSISNAVATGSNAGAMANKELTVDRFK